MPGKKAFEQQIANLDSLRQAAGPEQLQGLQKTLGNRNNFIVGKAAELVREFKLTQLNNALTAAFERFLENPEKTDPQCWAKNAIARTLAAFEYQEADFFVRGMRHIQMEPVWGGRSDTAGTLRATCALALIQCRSLAETDLLAHLIDLVADKDKAVRLELMRALSLPQREKAMLFKSIISTDLPPERYTPPDGRQQSASFKDNAIIPYEGIGADALTPGQRYLLLTLIQTYTSHLRPGHDQVWLEEIKRHLSETWFAWMGGFGDNDVFYYKVHNQVLLVEFDMHKGVFLNNDEPEKFHIHIVVRTPNGNDYGKDLLRQHLERFHKR